MISRAVIKEKLDDGRYKVLMNGVSPRLIENGIGDHSPENETECFVMQVGDDQDDLILIAIKDDVSGESGSGERRIYSLKNGEVKAIIFLNSDGEIIFNGGQDYSVQFTALKTAFDELQEKFNNHIHTTTATIGASAQAGIISPTTTQSIESIDGAKIESIRVP